MRFKTRLQLATKLVDLTPLVDVVFLMLIFFVVTSDILPLKSLHIEHPSLSHDSAPLTTQFYVVMDAEEVIYVGSKKRIVDLNSLETCLKEEIASIDPAFLTLVLSVDRRVDYGSFLRLFHVCQSCSNKIRLVYEPEGVVRYF